MDLSHTETKSASNGTTPEVVDDFGVCPKCMKPGVCISAGRHHWFVCKEHKLKWYEGSNLFSHWREQTREENAANEALLHGYTNVITSSMEAEAVCGDVIGRLRAALAPLEKDGHPHTMSADELSKVLEVVRGAEDGLRALAFDATGPWKKKPESGADAPSASSAPPLEDYELLSDFFFRRYEDGTPYEHHRELIVAAINTTCRPYEKILRLTVRSDKDRTNEIALALEERTEFLHGLPIPMIVEWWHSGTRLPASTADRFVAFVDTAGRVDLAASRAFRDAVKSKGVPHIPARGSPAQISASDSGEIPF